MSHKDLILFIDRLDRLEPAEHLDIVAQMEPTAMEVDDQELRFEEPVECSISAYLAGDDVILSMNAHTRAHQPCPICTAWAPHPIEISQLTRVVPRSECANGTLNLCPLIREELLFAVQTFLECSPSGCPERGGLSHYLGASQ